MGRSCSSSSSSDDKVKQVLHLLHKDTVLSRHQADLCSEAAIKRCLRARGGNVKKAAKQLRASLAWRETLDFGYLTADDFTEELASGVAFVAGHDDNGLPVLILRMRHERFSSRNYKRFMRFLVFTFEVAVASMPPGVEQWVMLIDFSGSSSSPLNLVSAILKLIADHYPERLAPSFFVDAPSVFYYLWKGVSRFMDHALRERWRFAFLRDHSQQLQTQVRLHEGTECLVDVGPCSNTPSFRHSGGYEDRLNAMSFLTPLSSPAGHSFFKRNLMDHSLGAVLAADMHQRSLSFSSPSQQRPPDVTEFKGLSRGDCRALSTGGSPVYLRNSRSRRSSRDVGGSSGKQQHSGSSSSSNSTGSSRTVDSFRPYVGLCRESYDESSYRALMKPPLGGLLSVIRNAFNMTPSGE